MNALSSRSFHCIALFLVLFYCLDESGSVSLCVAWCMVMALLVSGWCGAEAKVLLSLILVTSFFSLPLKASKQGIE